MAVTIKDVAKHAGVSTATVSRVLNRDPRTSETTRIQVQRSLKALGYNMNAVARGLRTKKTFSIGFVTANIISDYCMHVAQGVDDSMSRAGYTMFMCGSGRNVEEEKLRLRTLLEKNVEGVIIMPATPKGAHYREVAERNIPIVLVDRFVDGFSTDAVLVENIESTAKAIEYLLDVGFSRIGFIAGDPLMTSSKERLEGYLKAHERRNAILWKDYIMFCENNVESSILAMKKLYDLPKKPECIFTANYKLFVGAVRFIQSLKTEGLSLALASFDDPADLIHVPSGCIVSIAQPMQQIGEKAAELLLRRIKGDWEGFPETIRMEPEVRFHNGVKNVVEKVK
jgi:LacI family transcriptional regulator